MRIKGKAQQEKHLAGKTLSRKDAIMAKCYDCCGGFLDGRYDCGMPECSLYPFMVFKGLYEPIRDYKNQPDNPLIAIEDSDGQLCLGQEKALFGGIKDYSIGTQTGLIKTLEI